MNPGLPSNPKKLFVRISLSAAIALMFLGLATGPSLASRLYEIAYTGCGGSDAPVVDDAKEATVVALVNQERASRGLPPIKRQASLDRAARYHAADLANDNYFDHDTYDRNGADLVRVCGTFVRMRLWYDWVAAGENIAAGYRTPEEVMRGWMQSDGHRSNILSRNFSEIGVGYYSGAGDYGVYWVQSFGSRADEYPIIINNDSSETTDRDVDIYIYGDWSEMRLRNDSGAWGDWQPFASSFAWTINDGAGEHIISAEMRSGSESYSTCDKITLTGAALTSDVEFQYETFLPVVTGAPGEQQPRVTCD